MPPLPVFFFFYRREHVTMRHEHVCFESLHRGQCSRFDSPLFDMKKRSGEET